MKKEIAETGDPGVVEARDALGEVVFRYDPGTRLAVLRLPGAGLTLTCADGFLEVHASRGIRFKTDGAISLEAGGDLRARAQRLEAEVDAASLEASSIHARASLARFAWGKLEVSSRRAFEWAGAVYRSVEGLLHTRAGRISTKVSGAALIQADNARVQTKNEIRLDGSSVHLC